MGNVSAKNSTNKFDSFYEMMDYIATHYILTMDFESMSKLSEAEYCDKLVIITSDIIKKYFNELDIKYLAQRVKNGEEVNEMEKEKVTFVNKDTLETMDIKNDVNKSIKKKRVCIGIAKFYVKIAHIFAAILTTINPVYMYKDSEGNKIEKGLLEKGNIPTNVRREVSKTNICDNRIKLLNPLQKVENSENREGDNRNIYINPKVCELNLDASGKPIMLSNEPGINELMMLYMDDEYDYSNGTFKGMSEQMKYQFERDLKTFYTAFTGNKDMPETIKKFSDIKLRTYDKTNGCHTENEFKTGSMVSLNDELFQKYAKNMNNMIYNAQSNQQRLLSVINELFVFVTEPYGENKKIRINPKLTDASLDSLITKTRNIIIELYVTCENDFAKGIDIYEAIVERNILRTSKSQIEGLLKKQATILEQSSQPPLEQPQLSSSEQPSSTNVEQPSSTNVEQPSSTNMEQPSSTNMEQPSSTNMEQPSSTNMEHPSSTNVEQPSSTNLDQQISNQSLLSSETGAKDSEALIQELKKSLQETKETPQQEVKETEQFAKESEPLSEPEPEPEQPAKEPEQQPKEPEQPVKVLEPLPEQPAKDSEPLPEQPAKNSGSLTEQQQLKP